MTEVAGEVADGVITHGICTARYLREVTLPALDRGLATSGRTRDDIEVTCPGFIAVVEDESKLAKARDAMRRHVAFYALDTCLPSRPRAARLGRPAAELYDCSKTGAGTRWPGSSTTRCSTRSRSSPPRTAGRRGGARYGGLVDRINVSWWRKEWWPAVEEELRAL